MQPNEDDEDPFTDLGAEDRIRKPERKNAMQWLIVATGMAIMTFGGLYMVVIFALFAWGVKNTSLIFGLPGLAIMTAGYGVYQGHWRFRDK
jgi:hypothetical protein